MLLDRAAFPREKVCGDALIPDALNALRRLDLYDTVCKQGHRVDRLTILSPSGIRLAVPAECFTLRRERLDTVIVQHAIRSGVTFRAAKVTDLEDSADTVAVHVRNSDITLRARVLVLATGADITLLDRLVPVRNRQPSAVAVRCYFRSSFESHELIVSYDRKISPGYAWIFPMGNQEYNVGCGVFYNGTNRRSVNLRKIFERFLTASTVAAPLMRDGKAITPLKGARLRAGLDEVACRGSHRIVPIGECIGTTYPFTGEGIGKAMETGILAAEQIDHALDRNDLRLLRHVPAAISQQLAPRYRGYRVAQRWLSKPWLSDLLAARIRANRNLRGTLAGIVNETTDPQEVFTWRSLAPSLTRSLRRSRRIGRLE
jgi:flavin-dependent dehydrogenase